MAAFFHGTINPRNAFMSVELLVCRSVANLVKGRMDRLGLPFREFLSWKQTLEFNLSLDVEGQLKLVRTSTDSFHEYRSIETVGNRRFNVVWELEWNRSNGTLHLLDLRIVPLDPPLLKEPPASPV